MANLVNEENMYHIVSEKVLVEECCSVPLEERRDL